MTSDFRVAYQDIADSMMSADIVLECAMPRSTRLFEILQLLRHADAPMTALQIGEALEVTKRTIYRDMAALQAMRLPIQGEAGIGYVLGSGFDLPPIMFNHEEVEAIAVGLALLGRTGDPGLERAARSVATKISDVMPEGVQAAAPLHVSRWNTIPVPQINAQVLRRYVRESMQLQISYLDLHDQRTERCIKPLAVIYYLDAVLLAAWCELRHGFRHFRIDRIQACEPTGQIFAQERIELVNRWEQETELP